MKKRFLIWDSPKQAIIMLVVSACTLAIANILSRPSAQSRSIR